jgi:hypothetical protein
VTREPVGALQSDDGSISAVHGDACELPEQIRRERSVRFGWRLEI